MPLLKFRCTECGKIFDELVPLAGIEAIRCPECAGKTERAYEGKCAQGKSGCGGGCAGSCASCGGGCSH